MLLDLQVLHPAALWGLHPRVSNMKGIYLTLVGTKAMKQLRVDRPADALWIA
jgi:hypothetical protein